MKAGVEKFVKKGIQNICELSGKELVHDAAINPFLVKALGIDDFNSLARFYVYQRVGRSLVTSFGTVIENMVTALSGGEKASWWDVKAKLGSTTYYMSVKSGPRDMDKDQVQHFAKMARELMQKEPKAVPLIAMGYGKEPLGPIVHTLKIEGLDPAKHTLTGQKLYETVTKQKDYHKRLLGLISAAVLKALGGKRIVQIIEDKANEIAEDFKKSYKTVDDLLLDTF